VLSEPRKRITGNDQMINTLGRVAQGFVDISATASNAAITGQILALADARFVMMIAFPFGSTRAFTTAQDIRCRDELSTSLRSAVLIAPVSLTRCLTPGFDSGVVRETRMQPEATKRAGTEAEGYARRTCTSRRWRSLSGGSWPMC
jgi:hypothetical protein